MFALFDMPINCKFRFIISYCSPALEHLFSLYQCHKFFTLMFFTKTTFYKIFLHSFFCIANVHTKECHMLKLFSMRFSLNVMQQKNPFIAQVFSFLTKAFKSWLTFAKKINYIVLQVYFQDKYDYIFRCAEQRKNILVRYIELSQKFELYFVCNYRINLICC